MYAVVRQIPDSFCRALSAVVPESPIDVALARRQHSAYCAALATIGADLIALPADEQFPDCVFVEDAAVVANGFALLARSAAPSRRGEVEAVAPVLRGLQPVWMTEPATLDGGDCMRLGATIYVGRSARTNAAGIAQLARLGLRVVAIDLPPHVLHLKCVVSPLADDRVLLAEGTLAPSLFAASAIMVTTAESYAANAVAIGEHVIVAEEYPSTRERLEAAGFTTHGVPTSEVRKADGSLTCQSILW